MLFHELPAWAVVGRACQHTDSLGISQGTPWEGRGRKEGGGKARCGGRRRERGSTLQKGSCPSEGSLVAVLLTCFCPLSLCSPHGAFAVQICRRRAKETPEPEQVPPEWETVAQRRRGKTQHPCRRQPRSCPRGSWLNLFTT